MKQSAPRQDSDFNPSVLTGDTTTDWAVWALSLLLREIAESNQGEQKEPPPPPSFEEYLLP